MIVSRCLVLIALLCSLTGCLTLDGRQSARNIIHSYNPFGLGSPVTKDKVVIRSVLLEQPTGESYLTRDLWTSTLKPLPPEVGALLAENGIRVGLFPSNPPAELLERIESGESTVRPQETTVNLGDPKILPVNGPIPATSFQTCSDIGLERIQHELTDASFAFQVSAAAAEHGKLRLTFEPRVQHGQRQGWLRPTTDGTAFAWRDQKESERFPKLSFDVTVTPGEILVIGPTERPAQKLGGASFVTNVNESSRMRVFVLRAWRGHDPLPTPVPGRKLNRTDRHGIVTH